MPHLDLVVGLAEQVFQAFQNVIRFGVCLVAHSNGITCFTRSSQDRS
jgi:hypothetical protein